jgi:hypothetical protein
MLVRNCIHHPGEKLGLWSLLEYELQSNDQTPIIPAATHRAPAGTG